MSEERKNKRQGRPKGAVDKKPRKCRTDHPETNLPTYQDAVKEIPQEYNARVVSFIREITPKEPLDRQNVAEMRRRFDRYLELCAEWGMKVGNLAAYTAIGISKDLAYDWLQHPASNPERAAFIKSVQTICAMYRESLMQDGKINPVTGIFWQKNYDGFQDQKETVVTARVEQNTKSAEELQAKYLESAGTPQIEEHRTLSDVIDVAADDLKPVE